MSLRPYQAQGKFLVSQSYSKGNQAVVYCSPTGSGKCVHPDTEIIMFSGEIKKAKNIIKGDILMGEYSLPMNVLSTCKGTDNMYQVIPVKGESWICNSPHVLTLVWNNKREQNRYVYNESIDIPLNEYLLLPKSIKHCLKLYKTPVQFNNYKEAPIDPYFLGIWIGDGTKTCMEITKPDTEIHDYIFDLSEKNNWKARLIYKENKCVKIKIDNSKKTNSYWKYIRSQNLNKSIHIPKEFLVNSEQSRLQLLAGLLDTDGYLCRGSYEISCKEKQLKDDICFLAGSLGFSVYWSYQKKGIKSIGFSAFYYRITIGGELNRIPCKIKRRIQAESRKQIKNVLRNGFKIVPIGTGEYCGFTLNGDGRFLLKDFTVTHNTHSFADMTKDAISSGVPTMIICDRKELIDQADKKLKSLDLHATLVIPSYKDRISNLYLASVDTLRNRRLPDVGFVIADEAHKKTFDEILMEYKRRGANILGATATPMRTGKRFLKEDHPLYPFYPDYSGQMGNIYSDMIIPTTTPELLRDNFLVPCITYGAEMDMSDVDITRNAEGIEYNEKQLFQKFNKPKMYAGVVEKYIELTPGTRAVCFNINVEHSIKQCEEFNLRGIPAVHVDGKTPKHIRDKAFKDFHYGIYRVICNVGVATTGWDEATVETIIINRATMSLSLYLQMCGRGSRLWPEGGKTYFNIIDMGANVYKHGFWDEDREWSIELNYVSKKVGVAPIRECENCFALIPVSSTQCKYCNVIQEKRAADEQKLIEAKFVVLDKESVPPELRKPLHAMNVIEMEKYRVLKDYSVSWLVRQLISRGEDALREYAKMKNYALSWVSKQLEIAEAGRAEVKNNIWTFMQNNSHITNDFLTDYATKKLKANHTAKEIEHLMPKILQAMQDLKDKKINIA